MMKPNLLRIKIMQKDLNIRQFVKGLNEQGTAMNTATFYRKLNGTSEFTQTEIGAIAVLLGLKADDVIEIFFAQDVS